MPGPYMMMMPSPGMMQAPYMAPPPGWMPAPPIMYVEEGNQAQGQPGPPPASSPPPEVIAPPHGNPTTPSRDSAVAGYAKEKMSNNNSDVGVVREQETHEQQQARKEGFANLLSKALPTTSAPSEPKPEATKAGKAPASRSFNVVAAEEDSKARWNEIQAKMNSKKPK